MHLAKRKPAPGRTERFVPFCGQTPPTPPAMKQSAQRVLSIFRRYRVGPNQMLFINNVEDGPRSAMGALISSGLVVKERHRNAYYLTESGYAAVRSL